MKFQIITSKIKRLNEKYNFVIFTGKRIDLKCFKYKRFQNLKYFWNLKFVCGFYLRKKKKTLVTDSSGQLVHQNSS